VGASDQPFLGQLFHRHDRRLEGMRRLYPTSTSGKTVPRVWAPFISDVISPVQILPDIIAIELPPAPVAGAEWFFDVPPGQIWKIQSLSFTLNSSVVVVNREVNLVFEHPSGGSLFYRVANQNVQVANTTIRYSAGPGVDVASVQVGAQLLSLPAGFTIPQTTRIRSFTSNLDAGDQFGSIVILVTRVPEPRVGG